ncbi:MAG: phosphatidylglycerophosphatase A [Sedimentisphaerales bacterium]|nr:phosphatidylglycerophosphatase A [Sedimentisphaerales bacterium]
MTVKRWIAVCFGLGWLPVAPGTWGSLPPVIMFGLLMYIDVPPGGTTVIMGAMIVLGSVACLCCAPASVAAVGKDDPGEVVMDEFAGQALTLLAIPLLLPRDVSGGEGLWIALFGFLLFRAFDIVKPWPIRKLESFPGGWGILLDDVAAGVFSTIVLELTIYFIVRT